MTTKATWYESGHGKDLVEVDLDRFGLDAKDAERIEKVRKSLSARAGRVVTIEEIVKMQLLAFAFENRALIAAEGGAPVAEPPALPGGNERLARKAREIFLGMIP